MPDRLSKILKRGPIKKQYYKNIEYPSINTNPNDVYIISKIGDRLDLLANDFYGDSNYWWVISRANPDKIKPDSFFIDAGLQIRIPSDVSTPYEKYIELNK
tara:strand:+ start:7719 stop:8021 length:303 start_codon:yes stop_codon:yes gene_type:complete